MTTQSATSTKPYLHNSAVPFTSTPQAWADLAQRSKGYSDSELEELAYINKDSVRSQKYLAGDYQKWNKENNRQDGDSYIGPCVEAVILAERREARQKSS